MRKSTIQCTHPQSCNIWALLTKNRTLKHLELEWWRHQHSEGIFLAELWKSLHRHTLWADNIKIPFERGRECFYFRCALSERVSIICTRTTTVLALYWSLSPEVIFIDITVEWELVLVQWEQWYVFVVVLRHDKKKSRIILVLFVKLTDK